MTIEMGRFSEQSESSGFIKEIYQKLQNNLNAEQVKNFTNLENDEARFKFVSQHPNVKEFQVTLYNKSIKNADFSLEFKMKGNREFQKENWLAALDSYNKGLLLLPQENGEWILKYYYGRFIEAYITFC